MNNKLLDITALTDIKNYVDDAINNVPISPNLITKWTEIPADYQPEQSYLGLWDSIIFDVIWDYESADYRTGTYGFYTKGNFVLLMEGTRYNGGGCYTFGSNDYLLVTRYDDGYIYQALSCNSQSTFISHSTSPSFVDEFTDLIGYPCISNALAPMLYASKDYVNNIVNNKQNTLVPGDNITIDENNVISAQGGVEKDNITITENTNGKLQVIGVLNANNNTVTKIWTGTLAEYNAITSKDAGTIYYITDEEDTTATQEYVNNAIQTALGTIESELGGI